MSTSFTKHLQHLDIVFNKQKKANLVGNKEKCEFGRSKIKFLGYYIRKKACILTVKRHKVSLISQHLGS